MQNLAKIGSAVFLGLVVLFGSFAAASNDFAFGSQSLLAAAISVFQSQPSLLISKNTNSPSGTIIPGRSQVFAVFDVKGQRLTQAGRITTLPIFISKFNAQNLDIDVNSVVVNYRYCLPKGNIYAYGYKYGYNGEYCVTQSVYPGSSAIVKSTLGYQLTFTELNLPVYPDQTSALLTISGIANYTNATSSGRSARIQVKVLNGVVAQSTSCKIVYYGYFKGKSKVTRYGYTKCVRTSLATNLWVAYGNILTVLKSYGYSYLSRPQTGVVPIPNTTTDTSGTVPPSTTETTPTPATTPPPTTTQTPSTPPVKPPVTQPLTPKGKTGGNVQIQ